MSMQHHKTDRRSFCTAAGVTALGTAVMGASLLTSGEATTAAEPFVRQGDSRFQLGLAAYSLRDYFSFMKGKARAPKDPSKAIDMVGFLDYCVANGFNVAELTSYFFPTDADQDYFLELKRQAYLRGLTISGTAIGNNFTIGAGDALDQQVADAIRWIDKAAYLGAPHVRFFAGTGKQLDDHPERLDEAVEAMKRCADHAAKKGVFLGIENHGNLRPEQLLSIIRKVDHPWVGINLDTGNFYSDDPYADLEQCVGYAVNVQVKIKMRRMDKSRYDADLHRISKILRDSGYQGFVILEYEEDKPFEEIPELAGEMRKIFA